jgi:uncharacterized oxidoreductase
MVARGGFVVPCIAVTELTDFATRLFEAVGVPRVEAEVVARGLVEANLRGHDSHGVMRIVQYLGLLERGEYLAGVPIVVERETPALVACDGQWGLGQVQAHRLLDLLVPKAKALGVAAGTLRRCGHIGRLGEYAERVCQDGLMLLAAVNIGGAAQRIAPPGGVESRLGTNPLCLGSPTAGDPLVLDFATSVVAEGKVRVYYLDERRPVPEGWLQDHEGQPTTDPSVLYEPPLGSILPLGGDWAYKGFGLGLMLELLSAGLAGGETCHAEAGTSRGNNVFFLALDPNQFAGRDHLIGQAERLAAYVRACPRKPGVEAIWLPGDPEQAALRERLAAGVPIAEPHWALFVESAQRLGVVAPEVPARVDSPGGSG